MIDFRPLCELTTRWVLLAHEHHAHHEHTEESWQDLAIPLGAFALLGAGLVLAAFVLRALRRKRETATETPRALAIDVAALPVEPPPESGPQLTFYNLPVRLAVVVLAPAGRDSQMPPDEFVPMLLEHALPGLSKVVESHAPQVHTWPPQLSSHGFTQVFFNQVLLPGDHGKGTPWCSIAGKFEWQGVSLLVGLVCNASQSNSLSQVTVDKAGDWLDVLRVR